MRNCIKTGMKKLLLILLSLFFATTLHAQTIIRVTTDGTGGGTSWSNASSLQNAMLIANLGDQIWVQAGVYDVSTTLIVPSGVLMYGGFLGNEDYLHERSFARNRTIFDGGRSGYTAVRLGEGAVLNGFAVINGHAHRDDLIGDLGVQPFGGGVWMEANARVINSYILDNTASEFGGGIFAEGDGLVFNTLIAGNTAGVDGLAIWGTTLTVRNVTASQNRHEGDLPVVDTNFCNIATPAWVILGTQSFATDSTWLADALLWSDVVYFSTCNKETFDGGTVGPPSVFNVDCRSNPDFPGDLFSWCAVMRFSDLLCPAPWRVPSTEELAIFDMTFGGTGEARSEMNFIHPDYISPASLRCVQTCPRINLVHPNTTSRFIVEGQDTFPMLSVTATGLSAPFSFQWFYNTRPDTVGARLIVGATNSTFIPPSNTPLGEQRYYFCIISSECRKVVSNFSGRYIVLPFCDDYTPGWGETLGTVSFATTRTWTVENQIWSDVVVATACNKTSFDGANLWLVGNAWHTSNFRADCRTHPRRSGHMFSSCAIQRFTDTLCPYPWRVPTAQDFIDLDIGLGGTGVTIRTMPMSERFLANTYANREVWGGVMFTGLIRPDGMFINYDHTSAYWGHPSPAGLYFDQNITDGIRHDLERIMINHLSSWGQGLQLRCVRDTVPPPPGCNPTHPNWLTNMGTVTWGNTSNTNINTNTTTISGTGGRPTQTWSGAVFATACNKGNTMSNNAFIGGGTDNFNADCRQSLHTFTAGRVNGVTGDLFSWCAVMAHSAVLCPYPFRVPTTQDFANLHQNLGLTLPAQGDFIVHGNAGHYMPTTGTTTAPQIGGTWGGTRFTGRAEDISTPWSNYWSSTEVSATHARYLFFHATYVRPESSISKASGFALRCVRDN